jgi:hypothetical protein
MEKPKLVYTNFIRTTPKKSVSDWKHGSKWQHVFENEPDPSLTPFMSSAKFLKALRRSGSYCPG